MWRFWRIGRPALLAVALVGVAIAAGCGGDDGGQGGPHRGPQPQQVLERSRETAGAVRFHRPSTAAAVEVTAPPGALDGLAAGLPARALGRRGRRGANPAPAGAVRRLAREVGREEVDGVETVHL